MLSVSVEKCDAYTFGLNSACVGTLRRRTATLSAAVAEATLTGDLNMMVDAEHSTGASLGTISWISRVTLRR